MLPAAETPGTHAVREAKWVAMSRRALAIEFFSVACLTPTNELVFLSITVTVNIVSIVVLRLLLEARFPPGADTAPTDARDVEMGRFSRFPLRAPARNWPEGYGAGLNATATAARVQASFASDAHRRCGSQSPARGSWVSKNL